MGLIYEAVVDLESGTRSRTKPQRLVSLDVFRGLTVAVRLLLLIKTFIPLFFLIITTCIKLLSTHFSTYYIYVMYVHESMTCFL